MKSVRTALAALILLLFVTSPATATSFTTDSSDLWEANPPGSEDGWGMQLVQRGSVIFATLFVYGPSTAPTWYVATMNPSATQLQWSGDLYATTGPWFGTVPFNPANVTRTKVGTMIWTLQSVVTGNVTYTVDGVLVSKNVVRELTVYDNYAGHYGGGFHSVITGCANPALNGTVETIGILDIAQNGQSIAMQSSPTSGGSCTYIGTQTQYGQMGIIDGAYVCTDGEAGTFHLFEVQVNITGLTGRFTASGTAPAVVGCQSSGWFGGLRVTTF